MTREEQKAVRDTGKALDKAIRPNCKKHGYKSVSGYIYKMVGDYLYTVIVSVPPIDLGKSIKIHLWCKPLALDDIYWDVFDMTDTAKSQPFSFHVQGAFTAQYLPLEEWKVPISAPEGMDEVFDMIFNQADDYIAKNSLVMKTMQDFASAISEKPNQLLNIILCEIYEENYQKAMEKINNAIANHETGGFACGSKNIIEYAKEHCIKCCL